MTTWVSRHQKGKPFWILLEQEMVTWQWHQLDYMQIICTSLQTDNNHATTVLLKMLYNSHKNRVWVSRCFSGTSWLGSSSVHCDVKWVVTFHMSHRQHKMYSSRASVCLSMAACPHCCMDPDVSWGTGRGAHWLCTIGQICNQCMGFVAMTT